MRSKRNKKLSSIKKNETQKIKTSLSRIYPKKEKEMIFKLFKEQLSMERKIELLKQDIVYHKEVTLENIIGIFDPYEKGNVSTVEFLKALRMIGLKPNREITYLLFSRFDKNDDGKLDYNDLGDMIVPFDKEYAKMIASRNFQMKLTNESINSLKTLMEMYLNYELENIDMLKRISKEDIIKLFKGFTSASLDAKDVICIIILASRNIV